jgi:dTDP-4-dehydrorhamnose 3,5-epimerase-like enzyme
MIFEPTALAGAELVRLDRHVDARGFFARAWCAREFAAAALPAEAARGARWDDPAFAVPWPARPAVNSERDRSYPDFVPERTAARIAS